MLIRDGELAWLFPFNAEQSVNIVGEIGPLFAMFIVNGLYGIAAGTWALIICTALSLLVTIQVLGRPPVMPFIAGAVSLAFGTLTLITGDPMWIQIKVTLFNALVALLLWMGLRSGKNSFHFLFRKTFHYIETGWNQLTRTRHYFFLPQRSQMKRCVLGLPTRTSSHSIACSQKTLKEQLVGTWTFISTTGKLADAGPLGAQIPRASSSSPTTAAIPRISCAPMFQNSRRRTACKVRLTKIKPPFTEASAPSAHTRSTRSISPSPSALRPARTQTIRAPNRRGHLRSRATN